MTASPPSGPGQHGAWDQPLPGGGWPPPAGVGGYGNAGYAGGGYPEPPYGAYPDPAYGGGGYPPPGYAPPGYPPPRQGTNGFAIAALVFGIIGVALLGYIFGFIGLSQTKRTGQGGRGLAIAGLILSAMWTIGYILIVIVVVSSVAHRDPATGTVTQGGDISATALKVGDCVNNLKDSNDVLALPGVPCTTDHEGEVFAVFDLPAGDYPGQAAVDEQVSTQCNSRLTAYSPSAQDDSSIGLFSVYPLEQNWVRGDREVVCIATAKSGTSTGSIKGK